METATPSYWQIEKTLPECFGYILTSGTASDVTFLVGEDGDRIPAHKLVLISRSPVFFAMFEGLMFEKGDVTIPDIDTDIFQLFLRYLYTDEVDLTEENAVYVLSVARKYQVDILVSHCEEFLNRTLSMFNVFQILEHAHGLALEDLQNDCLRWIDNHPEAILEPTIAEVCRGCLASITESEYLLAEEIDVYNAILMWADAECKRQKIEATPDNRRQVLGDILYNVRFPVMDLKFLQKEVCHHKVLPAEDIVQTINYQHHKEKIPGQKLNYSERAVKEKRRLWRVEGVVRNERFMGTETVSFTVSNSVNLVGFGSFYSQGNNTANVTIYENCHEVYKADNVSRVTTESNCTGDVLLVGGGIQLKPRYVYTIAEHTDGKRKCHGILSCTGPLVLKFKNKETRITFTSKGVPLPNSQVHNGRQVPYLLLAKNETEPPFYN